MRGDGHFALTEDFNHWAKRNVEFVFGLAAHKNLVAVAEGLDSDDWSPLERNRRGGSSGRKKPNVKREIIEARGYRHLELVKEEYAEFPYQPTKCTRPYRVIALRKTIEVHEGQRLLVPEVRFHFYITNVRASVLSARQVIRESNDRCNQENLIEQTKNGVHAMRMPCDTLLANDAYMVMACLAWNLKAWAAQLWPDKKAGDELRRMEFRRFVACVIDIPCQVVASGRKLVHRFLSCPAWLTQVMQTHDSWKRLQFA